MRMLVQNPDVLHTPVRWPYETQLSGGRFEPEDFLGSGNPVLRRAQGMIKPLTATIAIPP